MKKIFIPSMLIAFAMICSCQKQDSTAEQQLAQRKTEQDAREKALDERMNGLQERVNALDERVNALAKQEKAMMNARINPTDVQGQISDPAQLEAEKQRMIQQLSTMIPDPSKIKAGDPGKQERPAVRQLGPEELQRQWQRNLDKARMSGKVLFPAAEPASPIPSPAVEATSPSPSPTPE
jgi:U3 small nucleolar RNA-associated protein 14